MATSTPTLLTDLLQARARQEPGRVAVSVDGAGSLGYAEWEARSNAAGRGLSERGVRAGDRVGLFFENTEWVPFAIGYLAVLKAGAIAVPLSSRFAPPQLRAILDRAEVAGLVTGAARPAA